MFRVGWVFCRHTHWTALFDNQGGGFLLLFKKRKLVVRIFGDLKHLLPGTMGSNWGRPIFSNLGRTNGLVLCGTGHPMLSRHYQNIV